jgi:hypothetical protein
MELRLHHWACTEQVREVVYGCIVKYFCTIKRYILNLFHTDPKELNVAFWGNMLISVMLVSHLILCNAGCHYAEYRHAECRYAEFRGNTKLIDYK